MSWPSTLPSRAVLCAVFAAVAVLWFANLGSRDLLHPDEGRYAEIAREMSVTGDWVTPRLNGLKYFEKPPLQYWITAGAYRLFGVHEWTARLWPAAAGLLAVLAIGIAGHALGGVALGTFAALALAGTLWHAGMAQIVSLDSGLAFFLTLAFAGLVIAQRPGTGADTRRRWMLIAWAAMAGATLSKGPIGIVLPLGALVVYSLINRDFEVWQRLHLTSGLLLFLVLTAPWFIAVTRANGEFLRFFFVHEHFERFLTEEHQRTGAWWYFIPLAAAGSLPWLVVLAFGARRLWRDGGAAKGTFSWRRLALVWAAFVFVFFSVSGSKLPSYILPMFAPLALVAADLLLRQDPRALARQAFPGAVVIGVVALGLLVGYGRIVARLAEGPQPVEILEAYGPWLKAAAVVAAVGAGAAVRRLSPRCDGAGPAGPIHRRRVARALHVRRRCDRRGRVRRVQPDALDIGYPAHGANRGAVLARGPLLSDRDVRPDAPFLSRPHDDARRLPGRARPRHRRRARSPDPEDRDMDRPVAAPRRGVRRFAPDRLRAACGRRRPDARSRARFAPRDREQEIR